MKDLKTIKLILDKANAGDFDAWVNTLARVTDDAAGLGITYRVGQVLVSAEFLQAVRDSPAFYQQHLMNELQVRTVKSSWISIQDRLPETTSDVLILTQGFLVEQVVGRYSGKWLMELGYNYCQADPAAPQVAELHTVFKVTNVTHWQPLPAAPEIKAPAPCGFTDCDGCGQMCVSGKRKT